MRHPRHVRQSSVRERFILSVTVIIVRAETNQIPWARDPFAGALIWPELEVLVGISASAISRCAICGVEFERIFKLSLAQRTLYDRQNLLMIRCHFHCVRLIITQRRIATKDKRRASDRPIARFYGTYTKIRDPRSGRRAALRNHVYEVIGQLKHAEEVNGISSDDKKEVKAIANVLVSRGICALVGAHSRARFVWASAR